MNKQVANVQLMQKMNRLKVLQFVRRNPDVSRPIIAAQTGLSLPSITNIVSYLLETGILFESGMEKVNRVGRKSTLLRFSADAYDLICIYLDEKNANAVFSIRESASYLGIGLANLVNLFNPSVIVINTGDFKDCPSLLTIAEEELRKRAYLPLSEHLSIEKISETEENTVCGTAYHLCNKLLDISFPENMIE